MYLTFKPNLRALYKAELGISLSYTEEAFWLNSLRAVTSNLFPQLSKCIFTAII